MSNVFEEDREMQNIGSYGGGAFGGIFAMIILVVVVLWLLFRDGHKDVYGSVYPAPGYGFYGNGYTPCVQPTFKDESNWEQEDHLQKKLCCLEKDIWKTDQDVWKASCETQKEVHCEGEKTRALIEANYIQDLRDRLNDKSMENLTLKNEMYNEKKFEQVLMAVGAVKNDVDKQFCKTDAEIAALSCELPKRPPVWCETITPNTHHIDGDKDYNRGYDNYPRHRRGNDCGNGYGYNDGYGYNA